MCSSCLLSVQEYFVWTSARIRISVWIPRSWVFHRGDSLCIRETLSLCRQCLVSPCTPLLYTTELAHSLWPSICTTDQKLSNQGFDKQAAVTDCVRASGGTKSLLCKKQLHSDGEKRHRKKTGDLK
ncbi:uncharacterized protein LOC133468375 isoform X2 [Phyllopteryx taeniolatus]|uniref:uncharacterized protein LOC133468375 isoform X2 n=1 Tax=Phyllopteryx taeniolatus TaxID=161469 RepID=UPI002AD2C06E|nr:uncharacterized protein LOC133468375 isoform X2 [Phyllopteryx taeniolatus]